MKIALTYNLKRQDGSKPADYFSECDSEETVNSITAALEAASHSVEALEAEGRQLLSYFKNNRVDMVFNICEGEYGRLRESEVPAILDYLNIPYTGSGSFSLALAMNKALTKKIIRSAGIPTPSFQLFVTGQEKIDRTLKFPLIVKPNYEGSGKGIHLSSVVNDEESLYSRVRETMHIYKQAVLAEEFIRGRELTVGILEGVETVILPVLEIDFSACGESGEYFYSWRMKEYQGNKELGLVPAFYCPARIDRATEMRVKEIALKTHYAVGCADVSRTDIRLSEDNTPYVLEINPLPGLNPHESNLPMMAYAAGMKYQELIASILAGALKRRRLN